MEKNKLAKQSINQRVVTIVAFIFGLAYALYCAIYWGGLMASGEYLADVAIYILMPHFIATGVAVVLSALALFLGVSWWNLAAGFVYLVAICCFPAYWLFLIVPAVLSFVAFYVMRKRERAQKPLEEAALAQKLDDESVDSPNLEVAVQVDRADEARADAAKEAAQEKDAQE